MPFAARKSIVSPAARRGLTLLELVVVLVVLSALASMLIPVFDNVADQSRQVATKQTLRQIQEAIVNRYATDMKGYTYFDGSVTHFTNTNTGALVNLGLPVPDPQSAVAVGRNQSVPQLAFLFLNPSTNGQLALSTTSTTGSSLGWHGPYFGSGSTYPAPSQALLSGMTATLSGFYGSDGTPIYGVTGDPTPVDAWGNPIVIRRPVYDAAGDYLPPTGVSPYVYIGTQPPDTSGTTTMSLIMAVIVSAGPDGVLYDPVNFPNNTNNDDITLKVQ